MKLTHRNLPWRCGAAPRGRRALTLIEITVLLVLLAVLALLLLASLGNAKRKAPRITCANNLKQIGIAMRLAATDAGERFAAAASTNPASALPEVPGPTGPSNWVRDPSGFFQMLSNELATPRVAFCPADPRAGLVRTGWPAVLNLGRGPALWSKTSYFISADADGQDAPPLLAGDRNITLDGQPVPPGWALLDSNRVLGWTDEIHRRSGNVVFSDGSVQMRSGTLAPASSAPNRILVP